MVKVVLVFIIVSIAILLLAFNTKVCNGGQLIVGCGRLLFPWSKKYFLSSNKVCCKRCFEREMKLFDFPSELYNVPENFWDLPIMKGDDTFGNKNSTDGSSS